MKKIFKTKVFKIVAGVIVAILIYCIGVGSGSSTAKRDIGKETVTYGELLGKIDKAKSKLKSLNDDVADAQTTILKGDKAKRDLATIEAKLKDKQAELDKELADGRKDIDTKLADANKQLSDTQAKVNDLQNQVNQKQSQLDSVTGQIAKAAGAPKTLQAGNWEVGKDIPAGRYTATPIGEGSNFAVQDGGSYPVNTILGSNGVPSYTFDCSEGQIIQTEAPVKLTPVQ